MLRLPALAITCVLIAACARMPAGEPVAAVEEPQPREVVRPPEIPFPADSLYDLLVAEFALRRQAYDVTLEKYLQQAPVLRDPGISAHTTHLAQFLQRGDEALESASLWVELAPESPEANNAMASLLAQQGRTIEAMPYLVTVQRLTGNANFPMLLNGFGQLSEARRGELASGINRLSAEYPQNTSLLLTQALLHTEYKQYDRALDDLRTLLNLEPEQPQAILLEARILTDQQAENPYARLQRVLKEYPDARRLRLQYARMLTTTDMAAAREQFEILSEQSPRDSDLLFSLALINREIGDREAARTYLRQTIALGQRPDEALYYLGRMAEDEDDLDEALASYMQVGIGPEYLAANSRIGLILVEQGELARSQQWFREQRELTPGLREQLFGLEADILIRAGETDAAGQLLNKALAELPASLSLRYSRAMLYEQLDELDAMEKDLRAMLAEDPDNATALNALGYTLADRTRRYNEALQLISRALELQPDEPAILDSMGWVLFRMGRLDEALQYLTRAYASFPDPEVAAHLGEVLWVKGDTDAAMAVWRDALVRDPEHPVLINTLQRLGITPQGGATDAAPTPP